MTEYKAVVDSYGKLTLVPLSAADLAQRTLDDAANIAATSVAATEKARQVTFNSDAYVLLGLIQSATAADIDIWLTNNVTTLAQARTVLAKLIKLIGIVTLQLGIKMKSSPDV